MQTITTTTAPAASPEAQASAEAHAVAATAAATAKREAAALKREAAKAKPASKPAASKRKPEAVAKPATAAKPAKRDAAEAEAKRAQAFAARTEARQLAAASVKAYYTDGASLPFKAAADTFSPINPKREPKRATVRQSALLASMLVTGTFKRDGTFTRGGFVIDGRNLQPESGCLSDMLNRVVTYVSGPITGANQRDAVFRLNVKAAIAEITAQLPASPLRSAALKRAEAILSGKA